MTTNQFVYLNMKFEWQCSEYLGLNPTYVSGIIDLHTDYVFYREYLLVYYNLNVNLINMS